MPWPGRSPFRLLYAAGGGIGGAVGLHRQHPLRGRHAAGGAGHRRADERWRAGVAPEVFYFGLLTGATLGGNLTPIGASANIAAIGILRKNGETVAHRATSCASGCPLRWRPCWPARRTCGWCGAARCKHLNLSGRQRPAASLQNDQRNSDPSCSAGKPACRRAFLRESMTFCSEEKSFLTENA